MKRIRSRSLPLYKMSEEAKGRLAKDYRLVQVLGGGRSYLDGFDTIEEAQAAKADREAMGMRGLSIVPRVIRATPAQLRASRKGW